MKKVLLSTFFCVMSAIIGILTTGAVVVYSHSIHTTEVVDQRRQVEHPSSYSHVVHLSIFFGSNESYCSGVVIDPQVVLTAAHCLRMDNESMSVAYVSVINGNHLGDHPKAYRSFVSEKYDPVNHRYDYGVILLEEPLSSIEPAQLDPYQGKRGDVFETISYPADKPSLTMWRSDHRIVSNLSESTVWTETDGYAYPGESGAALFNMEDGSPKVVAVLMGISKGTLFTPINEDAIDEIERWMRVNSP